MEEARFIADFGLVFIAARVYGVQTGCICLLKFYMCGRSTKVTFGK